MDAPFIPSPKNELSGHSFGKLVGEDVHIHRVICGGSGIVSLDGEEF
jgi:hypothetical protein